MELNEHVKRCIALAQQAESNPASVGVLSSGERIIVAFLHNKMDWLPAHAAHPLDALDSLSVDWRAALMVVHKAGWQA